MCSDTNQTCSSFLRRTSLTSKSLVPSSAVRRWGPRRFVGFLGDEFVRLQQTEHLHGYVFTAPRQAFNPRCFGNIGPCDRNSAELRQQAQPVRHSACRREDGVGRTWYRRLANGAYPGRPARIRVSGAITRRFGASWIRRTAICRSALVSGRGKSCQSRPARREISRVRSPVLLRSAIRYATVSG